MPHAGKAYFNYNTDTGGTFAFLQATDIAIALGNAPATVGTPRMPDKLKPRKIALRVADGGLTPSGAPTFTYAHHVFGGAAFTSAPTVGSSVTDGVATWTVVGYDDETDDSVSAY